MAKKAKAQDLVQDLEQNIQKAINDTPGIHDCSEDAYCNAVLDALDSVGSGLKMRLEELDD